MILPHGEGNPSPRGKKERKAMKKTSAFTRIFTLALATLTVLTASVMAAGVGSSDDPLVTLSYLNEKFLPQVLSSVDQKITARNEEVSKKLSVQIKSDAAEFERKYADSVSGEGAASGTADSFTVITLAKEQMLYGDIGCEVMLRVGSASCVANAAPGLVDETSGGTLAGGSALEKNHLYMMTVTERGVRATAEGTKVLVRGTYSVA